MILQCQSSNRYPAALDEARGSDMRRVAGKAIRPLDAVPVVIKYPKDIVGSPTTASLKLLHTRLDDVDLIPAVD